MHGVIRNPIMSCISSSDCTVMYYPPVPLQWTEFASLNEELDTADMTLCTSQVEGGAVIIVGCVHVGVGVPEPGNRKWLKVIKCVGFANINEELETADMPLYGPGGGR